MKKAYLLIFCIIICAAGASCGADNFLSGGSSECSEVEQFFISNYYDIDNSLLDKYLDTIVKINSIPNISVMIVDKDNVLYSYTGGNKEKKDTAAAQGKNLGLDSLTYYSESNKFNEKTDTPFILGSLSKSVTALCVMQLVEKGLIDLDAPLSLYGDYSMYFKNGDDAEKIVIRSLLNQNSGINTYQRLGKLFIDKKISGKYRYANANYALLGFLVENVSGMSFSDYVRENVFIPLNMTSSGASLEESLSAGLIEGYRNYFGIPVKSRLCYPRNEKKGVWLDIPAGYISASASDMASYLQMYLKNLNGDDLHLGGAGQNSEFFQRFEDGAFQSVQGEKTKLTYSLISGKSICDMLFKGVSVDSKIPYIYGMGWRYTQKEFDTPVLFHTGSVENFNSRMFLLPEKNIGIAVLVNMNDYFVFTKLFTDICRPLLGECSKKSINSYLYLHASIDIICLCLACFSVLVFVFSFKKKNIIKYSIGGFFTFKNVFIHIVFPLVLFLIIPLSGTPLFVIWGYVRDLCLVLFICAGLLFLSGVIKYCIIKKDKKNHYKSFV